MRIGINCYSTNPTYKGGVNSYTFGLIEGFSKLKTNHSFVVYCQKEAYSIYSKYNALSNWEVVVLDSMNIVIKLLLRGSMLLNVAPFHKFLMDLFHASNINIVNQNVDIVYTPTTVLRPYQFNVPSILSMHDIQQAHYPEFFTKKELLIRRVTFGLSAKHADYMQASSEFIREDLVKYFGFLQKNQLFVIPEGVDIPLFSTVIPSVNVIDKYSLPKNFIFFPAQLWKHKNHITILKALKVLKEENNVIVPLVLTGEQFSASKEIFDFIENNNLSEQVFYLGKVCFEDLIGLYQKALFLITAVLYESSSLPLLEAAAAGTALIASRTPPNVEMSEVLNINMFDPEDSVQLANLLKEIWENNQLIEEQTAHNKISIQYYSWQNVASKYVSFFEKVNADA